MGYHIAQTTAEVSAFSGQNITWPFPTHRPDSYSLRVNQGITDHIGIGASVLSALLPEEGGSTHNRFLWIHDVRGRRLYEERCSCGISADVWTRAEGSESLHQD